MKRSVFSLAIAATFSVGVHTASADNGQAPLPLANTINIGKVDLLRENALAGGWDGKVSCHNFTGTHAGNEISIEAVGSGGDGHYRHTLVYTLENSYRIEDTRAGQYQKTRKRNGTITLELPELKDEVPFVQQTVFLITRDRAGHTATTSKTFVVSRPVVLSVSNSEKTRAANCMQRYSPYPSTAGVLSNGSTNLSTIEIKQGVEKIWTATRGWQWGVYVSPFSFLGLGNLLSLNADYFRQTSKQTVETIEISSQYRLNPGDYMQVYVQPTRYVTAYDATIVEPCGGTKKVEAAYMFQWWGFSYHIYPVNPFDKKMTPVEAVGAPAINTCSNELTPSSIYDSNTSSPYEFRGTNK